MPSRDTPSPHDESRSEGRWGGEPARDAGRREPERRFGRNAGGYEGRERDTEAPEVPGAATFTHPEPPGRGSAFASPRAVQTGPGGSYGGSNGRTSGSQAYGYEPMAGTGREIPSGPDSAQFSQSVYDRQEARQRSAGDWSRPPQELRRPAPEASRGRSWPASGEAESGTRPGLRPGADRHDDTQFDPDYRQWREEQMRMLDREYAQWRQERYRKFAEEFSQWRSQRLQGQQTQPAQPRTEPGADAAAALDRVSALGPTDAGPGPLPSAERLREEREPERERQGGGLLSSLLGGHGDRHTSKP